MSILAVIGKRREALKRSARLAPTLMPDMVVRVFDVGGRRYMASSLEEAELRHREWLRRNEYAPSDFERGGASKISSPECLEAQQALNEAARIRMMEMPIAIRKRIGKPIG